jgi:hypothetical protein
MGSLVHVELLNNPKYRRFLRQALPCIDNVGIKHFFMSSVVWAAKENGSGYVEFGVRQESPWTAKLWILPLISRNVDRLMYKLQEFIISLLQFAKPEMKITDSEWGEAYIEKNQFIGSLDVAHRNYLPGEQHFATIVHVRLVLCRRSNAVPILKQSVAIQLTFEKWMLQVRALAALCRL